MLRYRFLFRVEMLRYRFVLRVEMLRYRFVFRVEMLRYRFVFRVDMLRYRFVFRVEMLRYRFVFRVEMLRYRIVFRVKMLRYRFVLRVEMLRYRIVFNQQPLEELDELKNNIEHGCSDPRMHPLHQDRSEHASKEAERRIDDDFGNLTALLQSYVEEHQVLPYCMILHSLAYRYLGGGLLDPTHKDEEFPYRSSPQITMMFWNLGNWCRSKFEKCPVPERFQQLIPHIDYSLDEDHNKFDENKTQFNNYFINVIKNFGGHLFMNCEAGSLYPHRGTDANLLQ